MSRRTRLRLAACMTVLSTVPLLACGGGTEAVAPPPLTTPKPSASPSEPPRPVPPSTVPAATSAPGVTPPEPFPGELNETDATTFAAYYLQVLNYTRQTNDSSQLRAISDPTCEECLGISDMTDQLAQFGMHYANPSITFEWATLDYYDEKSGEADVRLTVSGDLGVFINADGSTQGEPSPFEHAEATVLSRYTPAGWRLTGLP